MNLPVTYEWWSDGNSYSAVVGEPAGAHTTIGIFAGPDPEHRANAGTIVLRNEEVHGFLAIQRYGFEPKQA